MSKQKQRQCEEVPEPLNAVDKRWLDGILLYLRAAPVADRRTEPWLRVAMKSLGRFIACGGTPREQFSGELKTILMAVYLQGYRDHMEGTDDGSGNES